MLRERLGEWCCVGSSRDGRQWKGCMIGKALMALLYTAV